MTVAQSSMKLHGSWIEFISVEQVSICLLLWQLCSGCSSIFLVDIQHNKKFTSFLMFPCEGNVQEMRAHLEGDHEFIGMSKYSQPENNQGNFMIPVLLQQEIYRKINFPVLFPECGILLIHLYLSRKDVFTTLTPETLWTAVKFCTVVRMLFTTSSNHADKDMHVYALIH